MNYALKKAARLFCLFCELFKAKRGKSHFSTSGFVTFVIRTSVFLCRKMSKTAIFIYVYTARSTEIGTQERSIFCVCKCFFAPVNDQVMTKMMTKNSPTEFVKTRILSGFLALRPKNNCSVFRPLPSHLRNPYVCICLL